MGNQACCCHFRPIGIKSDPITPPPKRSKKKPKKSPTKPGKIPSESIQNFFSSEINEFLEKIQNKSLASHLPNPSDETTEDFSSTILKTTTNTSLSDTLIISPDQPPDDDVFYIELPQYSLESIGNLTEREQKEVSWLLLQNQGQDEEVDGYLPVQKKNRYGVKQHRWILFTTAALYLVLPHNFMTCRRKVRICEIVNIFQTINKKQFALEVMSSEREFLLFYSVRTSDAVCALQNLKYFINSELKQLVILQGEKEILAYTKQEEKYIEEDILFLTIKADYGYPGEELLKTVELYSITASKKKTSEKMTMFITNKTVYYLDQNKRLFNYMDLDDIKGITMIDEKTEAIISSDLGDIWVYTIEIDFIAQDLKEIILNQTQRTLPYLNADAAEATYNPMPQVKKGTIRKVNKDIVPMNGFREVQTASHLIDDILRVI